MLYLVYRIVLFFFAALGAFLSGILIWYHENPGGHSSMVSAICGGEVKSGCRVVSQSDLSTLFYLPMALWGYFFYVAAIAMILVSFLGKVQEREKNSRPIMGILFYLSAFGLGFDIFLAGYSLFFLKTICNLCLVTYFAGLGMAVVTILWGIKMDKKIFHWNSIFQFFQNASLAVIIQLFLAVGILFSTGLYIYAQSSPASSPQSLEIRKAILELKKEFYGQKPLELNLANRPYLGEKNAKLVIVEFADPLCPHCRNASLWLKEYQKKHPSDVKIYQLSYPLDSECNKGMSRQMHPGACFLSYSLYCAGLQGRFWEFNEWSFRSLEYWYSNGVSEDFVFHNVQSLGVDSGKLTQCIRQDKIHKMVQEDIAQGEKAGVTGTPTLLANGKRLPPIQFVYLEMLLDLILQNMK